MFYQELSEWAKSLERRRDVPIIEEFKIIKMICPKCGREATGRKSTRTGRINGRCDMCGVKWVSEEAEE